MELSAAPGLPHAFATFGDLLKYLRRRVRLTQLELSIAVGYSEAQISRLEKNLRLPDLAALKALFIPALHLEEDPELARRFLDLAESARQEDAPTPGIAPYKGLLFFDQVDSDLFFGRESLTARLAGHVMDLVRDAHSRFLSVVGPSGSGKSSLMRAGLAAALNRAGWCVLVFTPTAHPMQTLEAKLSRVPAGIDDRVLLLVDQFEEVFTLCRDELERIAFIERLIASARDESRKITVVIALRADFYAHCAQYPLLREAVAAEQEFIGQMTLAELRHAIEEPARRGGWEFERGLVDVLLNDIGAQEMGEPEPGALPLLSHALLATWERRSGHRLTLEGYRASGGVRGAIAETAESVFADQLNQAQQELARDVFLRLTELGEGTEDTRRRAALNELVHRSVEAANLRAVLDTLAEARLITLNEDSAEVAHEALIREWERLHEWLTQDRDGLRLHRHLTESTHEWEGRGHDPAELYRGARLAQAREWTSTNEERLNSAERDFLSASMEQEQHEALEREAQRQRELQAAQELAETQGRAARQLRRRAVYLTAAFAAAMILAGAAVFFGGQSRQNALSAEQNAASAQKNAQQAETNARQAESEQRIATSRELAAAAISNLDQDPERSILLALQAESTARTLEAQNALHRSILASHVVLVLHHDAEVWSVAYSPDGKRIATASQDETAKIWDAATGELLLTLRGHTGSVNGVVFSPDGKRIATGGDDHTAKIWDAATGKELLTLSGHTDWVYRVAFSPDGKRVATAGNDGTARIWDATTGEELLKLSSQGELVWDIAFSPDGKRLATSGSQGNDVNAYVRVWDSTSGTELLTLPVENGFALRGVAFSPDGARLAVTSAGFPGGKVWDAATGEVLLSGFPDHRDALLDIAFSLSGKLLATGSFDNTAKISDPITGRVLYTLAGHTGPVNGVALSPDGTRLATASWDHTARLWDITPAKEARFVPVNVGPVNDPRSLFVSATPEKIWTITEDPKENSAVIRDAVSGEILLTLSGLTVPISRATYTPDGILVAGIQDKAIAIWDAMTGTRLRTLSGHTDQVLRIAFSPDGARLASASANGELILWDPSSGKELVTLQGPTVGSSPAVNTGDSYAILALAFNPDGNRLASGDSDGNGIIWDTATGKRISIISRGRSILGNPAIPEVILDAAYSPDGKLLALAGDRGTTRILDALTGKEVLALRGQISSVMAVRFSPDGKLVTTASDDGMARVWDAATGVNVLSLPAGVNAGTVSFSADGKRLAVGSWAPNGPGVYVFVLPIDDLMALARSRVTRSLTTEECQQYLHVEQCPPGP